MTTVVDTNVVAALMLPTAANAEVAETAGALRLSTFPEEANDVNCFWWCKERVITQVADVGM